MVNSNNFQENCIKSTALLVSTEAMKLRWQHSIYKVTKMLRGF